ncbi:hypothetical protein ACFLTD_04520 [Elusimicrobiota bacterium]
MKQKNSVFICLLMLIFVSSTVSAQYIQQEEDKKNLPVSNSEIKFRPANEMVDIEQLKMKYKVKPAENVLPKSENDEKTAEDVFLKSKDDEKPAEDIFLKSENDEKPAEDIFPKSGYDEKPAEDIFPQSEYDEKPAGDVFPQSEFDEKSAEDVFPKSESDEKPAEDVLLKSEYEEKPAEDVLLKSEYDEKPAEDVLPKSENDEKPDYLNTDPAEDQYGDIVNHDENGNAIEKTHSFYEDYSVENGKLIGVGPVQAAVVEQYEYNEQGLLSNVKKKSMSFAGGEMKEVWQDNIHDYDDQGNLMNITSYNDKKEVVAVEHMEKDGSYTLDGDGNLISETGTDEVGRKVTINYDPDNGKIMSKVYYTQSDQISHAVDADNRLLSKIDYDDQDRMVKSRMFFYDVQGNLANKVVGLYDEFRNLGATLAGMI